MGLPQPWAEAGRARGQQREAPRLPPHVQDAAAPVIGAVRARRVQMGLATRSKHPRRAVYAEGSHRKEAAPPAVPVLPAPVVLPGCQGSHRHPARVPPNRDVREPEERERQRVRAISSLCRSRRVARYLYSPGFAAMPLRMTDRTVSWLTPKSAAKERRLLVAAYARIAPTCSDESFRLRGS